MKYPWLTGTAGVLLAAFLTIYALQLELKLALNAAHLSVNKAVDQADNDLTAALTGMEQMFLGFQQYLELMEQRPELDQASLRRAMDTLVLDSHYMVSLVVTDNTGDILYWTNSGPRPSLGERSYFTFHTRAIIDGVHLSEPLPSIMSPGQWVIGASKAIRYPDESLNKVLIAIIDTRRLFNTLETAVQDSPVTLTVLSGRGDVYARSPDHDAMVGNHHPEMLEELPDSPAPSGMTTIRKADGRRQLLLFRHIDAYPLVIRAELPLGAMTVQQPSHLLLLIAAGALVTLILLWQLSTLLHLHKREKNLQSQLRRETLRDPLTGLPLWAAGSDEEIAKKHEDTELTLLMIGLDRYPQLLSEHGEATGNLIMAQSATMIRQCLPANAQLSRYFCSRFILVLPETDEPGAMAVAEQIRRALDTEITANRQQPIQLSTSIGVTQRDIGEEDLLPALTRASTALSTAINHGGNQICRLATRETWLEHKGS
ncbi:MAG: diguanylate cyclase [Pelovirga sp.]